jgi:sensor histidine kinase YesM
MEKFSNKVEMIKIWLAVGMVVFGCGLIVAGFIVAPLGIISNSVLVAFGEVLTFAGTILGINYVYSTKMKGYEIQMNAKLDEKLNEITQKENKE